MSQTLVKICGLTDVANALACVEAGANYLGINFHPPSSRFLPTDQAIILAQSLAHQAKLVGLFVDRSITEVVAILEACPAITTIQLHGHEDVAYLASCRDLPTHPQIIRAFRLHDDADIEAMVHYLESAFEQQASPDAILIDALVTGHLGGTGQAIPLDLLDRLPRHPRLILAGGLNPSDVADRVRRVRPWMVDVASGVESAPGFKDPNLVASFVAAVRATQACED